MHAGMQGGPGGPVSPLPMIDEDTWMAFHMASHMQYLGCCRVVGCCDWGCFGLLVDGVRHWVETFIGPWLETASLNMECLTWIA
jgi:hypothetical protein